MTNRTLRSQLIAAGLFQGRGDVDLAYFCQTLGEGESAVSDALRSFVSEGLLRETKGWICSSDGVQNPEESLRCHCEKEREPSDRSAPLFVRVVEFPSRDPSAVFLVHGMNTLGSWQESLSWKLQLLYGRSIPVFVFKYGRDWTSPLTLSSQEKRVAQLAESIRRAQRDLEAAGRKVVCDLIAHSFGSLLVAKVLDDPQQVDLTFGRLLLTGSIVPVDYGWSKHIASGRVEGVLNHRAGQDAWVRLAPWVFPGVGPSGFSGFIEASHVGDYLSSGFGHSDYFKEANFDAVTREAWTQFLNGHPVTGMNARLVTPREPTFLARHRFWVGRLLLLTIIIMCAVVLVLASVAIRLGFAEAALETLGLLRR